MLSNGWSKVDLQKALSVNVDELPTFVLLGVSWPFDTVTHFLVKWLSALGLYCYDSMMSFIKMAQKKGENSIFYH